MSYIPSNYIEKTYAGWLGKLIGVRYGAPTEGASFEQLRQYYGELDGYILDYKDFAADDDSNGPMFFLRALEDSGKGADITPVDMSMAWLNYPSYEHGFYWWGGYGNSTEHTAYLNLQNGIPAPRSGSVEQNGAMVAEQIGGQIFIDTWGLVAPNNTKLASDLAGKMASVSHGGNGMYGGMFIAACISAAYTETDIEKVIEKALATIPEDCDYAVVTRDVMRFYHENPDDWEKCFWHIRNNYWQERFPGPCHIMPNSALMVMGMMYGQGDFDKTLNITHMGGWDTDCTVGNIGAIMGTFVGLEGINYDKWRKQINDFFVSSSCMGSLNIMNAPGCVAYIAKQAYELAGEAVPEKWADFVNCDHLWFDFELPGSTHAMRARMERMPAETYYFPDHKEADQRLERAILSNTDEVSNTGERCLKISSSGREKFGSVLRIHHKTFYHPEDLHDDRYEPCFSPIFYPGMTVQSSVMVPKTNDKIKAAMYVIDGITGKEFRGEAVKLVDNEWAELTFKVPAMNARIEEVGVVFFSGWIGQFTGYVDDFRMFGKPDYTIDFSKEQMEDYTLMHHEVSQFTHWKGMWGLENNHLVGVSYDRGEAYTGNYDMQDYTFIGTIIPKMGTEHRLLARVQGAIRSYSVGFTKDNKLVLEKNANGLTTLDSMDYEWEYDKAYTFSIMCDKDMITVCDAEGNKLLECKDENKPHLYGCIGAGVLEGSRSEFADFKIVPIV